MLCKCNLGDHESPWKNGKHDRPDSRWQGHRRSDQVRSGRPRGGPQGEGVHPGLGTVLVGEDPASQKYVAGKHRDCAQVGIASIQRELPATATQEEIEAVVRELNEDPECTGYIVQLPLPRASTRTGS